MKYKIPIYFLIILVSVVVIIENFQTDSKLTTLLDQSGPYIGVNYPNQLGFDGTGITIAVIDTGVDYNHPDLLGFGPDGKVIGGYDYVENDSTPIDTSGHGTQVAGIIAADGNLKGIAPKAKILSYRVSDDGDSVSSDLIVKAIKQAIEDDADIINISLGVNKTNSQIDDAVNLAISKGIVVIVAAGNDGPGLKTIGSPGRNPNAITVGATYNNITSSLVATLQVGDELFSAIPMVGNPKLTEAVKGKVIFGDYGRERDLTELDVKDSILLVERGSDVEGEIVYFSDKEANAANAGAKALLVYNNEKGIFLGELIHEFAPLDYQPKIPSVSLSNEDGLNIKQLLNENPIGVLNIFNNPDFVAHYSSRGPVSQFYIKPDLVAPGTFVNTTLTNGQYNLTTGTSFAAPHVTGTAALILQKNPDLGPDEVKSLLITTSDVISNSFGAEFPAEIGGAGRVNATSAFNANLIIDPPQLTFNLSPQMPSKTKLLHLENIEGNLEDVKVRFDGNDAVDFDYKLDNNELTITFSIEIDILGEYEGRIIIQHDGIDYNIPIIIHKTKGSLQVDESNGVLNFVVDYPDEWVYTKITIINKETGYIDTTSITPTNNKSLQVYEPGTYWVEALVSGDVVLSEIYQTIEVQEPTAKNNFDFFKIIQIPEKPIFIILAVLGTIILVGLKIRK